MRAIPLPAPLAPPAPVTAAAAAPVSAPDLPPVPAATGSEPVSAPAADFLPRLLFRDCLSDVFGAFGAFFDLGVRPSARRRRFIEGGGVE